MLCAKTHVKAIAPSDKLDMDQFEEFESTFESCAPSPATTIQLKSYYNSSIRDESPEPILNLTKERKDMSSVQILSNMGPLKNSKKRKMEERDLEKQIESVELNEPFFKLSVGKRAKVATFTDPGPSIGTVWVASTPEPISAEEDAPVEEDVPVEDEDVAMGDDNSKGKGKAIEEDSDISELSESSNEGMEDTANSDIMDYSDSNI